MDVFVSLFNYNLKSIFYKTGKICGLKYLNTFMTAPGIGKSGTQLCCV